MCKHFASVQLNACCIKFDPDILNKSDFSNHQRQICMRYEVIRKALQNQILGPDCGKYDVL